MESSPEGTAKINRIPSPVSRPFGTCSLPLHIPTLKRWAILNLSLRDKSLADFPKDIGLQAGLPRGFLPQRAKGPSYTSLGQPSQVSAILPSTRSSNS